MSILSTLNGERFGTWTTVLGFLQDLNRRETGSLAALNTALSAPPEEQRALGEGDGVLVLADIAADLRVQKGPRLAAVRCAIEAGVSGPPLATLFLGGGELAADPRLGGSAKRFVEAGIPVVLADPQHPAGKVSIAAGHFARAVQAGASVVGLSRVKELLAAAPPSHAGVRASLFALGQGELPATEIDAWKKLLREACQANRKAPAAAKRLGLAPPWPPNLPEVFKDLIADAEKFAASVVSVDAAKGGLIKGTAGPAKAAPVLPAAPTAVQRVPVPNAPAIQSRAPAPPRAGSLGAPLSPGRSPPPPPSKAPAPPAPEPTNEVVAKQQAPIRRSPFRKPTGMVMEGPFVAPTRQMPAVSGQVSPGSSGHKPSEQQASVPLPEGPKLQSARGAAMPGLSPLPTLNVDKPLEFDSRGRRIPRGDRWRDDEFDWEEPILPPTDLRSPGRAFVARGPFAQRLQSLFNGRPEAVERICAAAEARALIVGPEALLRELAAEVSRPNWTAPAPADQLVRLQKITSDESRPEAWRSAARILVEAFSPKNA